VVVVTRATVLVNNFDYGEFVGQAIESALDQDWDDLEVVVVDDGSTDGSQEILERYRDRATVVCKENGGQASALNAGFARATGDVVLLLDADDWFLPGKVRRVVEVLEADVELGWCFHPLAYDGGAGAAATGTVGRVDARDAMRRGEGHGALAPATSGLAFRRDLLGRILPMPEEFRVPLPNGARGTAADAFVKVAALALAPGMALDERLAVQRLHGRNAYTGTRWADPRRAVLELQIAEELRRRWPELRRYALARGLGGLKRLAAIGAIDDATGAAADAFVAGCTPAERARILTHRLGWKVRRPVGADA
jgi:CTP:molybdopterin cytidylyltransferase MocA